jgi:hypothetical protein
MSSKKVLFGLYDDEQDLMSAVRKANEKHLEIMDVYSPFPVHGLDPILGLKESRLHIVGFIFGALGTLTAFGFMTWALASDWPIIYGGKPYWPVPSFIPITFELTVLFASIGMVVTFYTICGMGPGVSNPVLHDRITDDKFCIAFNVSNTDDTHNSELESYFQETGATLVETKEL